MPIITGPPLCRRTSAAAPYMNGMTDINATARNAREEARTRKGEFGEQNHSAPEMTLGQGLDLSTHTPVDVDTKLDELYDARAAISQRLRYPEHTLERAENDLAKVQTDGERYQGQREYLESAVAKAQQTVDALWEEISLNQLECAPYEDEFKARGGWTRAFLAASTNGHVHRSMDCSTCNREGKLTRFAWMTAYSGADEDTIVGAAGERACTTCYPSAPVDVLSRPTQMFSKDEMRKQREREERAAAKKERDAKRIANSLTEDGSELVVVTDLGGERRRPSKEHFKTERAAVIWATDRIAWRNYGYAAEARPEEVAAIRTIAEAIAKKHGTPVEYVMGELDVKGQLKAKRITKKEADQKIAALAAKHGVA